MTRSQQFKSTIHNLYKLEWRLVARFDKYIFLRTFVSELVTDEKKEESTTSLKVKEDNDDGSTPEGKDTYLFQYRIVSQKMDDATGWPG